MRCAHTVASRSSKGRSSGEPKCLRSRISTGVRTESPRILFTERPAKLCKNCECKIKFTRFALRSGTALKRELKRRRKSSRPSRLRQIVSAGQESSRAAVIFQLTPQKLHLTKPRKLQGAAGSPVPELRKKQNTGLPATF